MYLNKSELQVVCSELLADLDGELSLKWDKRFQALLSEFPSKDKENISSILDKHLIQKYDRKTIKTAPDNVLESAGLFGDLRSDQLLFSSADDSKALVLAAWWPWGDGERISLRILSPDPEAKPPKKPGFFSKIIDFIID